MALKICMLREKYLVVVDEDEGKKRMAENVPFIVASDSVSRRCHMTVASHHKQPCFIFTHPLLRL